MTKLPELLSRVKCGSRAGYQAHRRNDETPCDACRRANSEGKTAFRNIRRAEEREPGTPMAGFSVEISCRSCGGALQLQNLAGPLFNGGEYKIVMRCRSCHLSYLVRVLMGDGFRTEPNV